MAHDYYSVDSYVTHYDTSPLTTRAVRYYSRYLLQKAMSVFKWTLPETWDQNYFLYTLYTLGFIAVTDIAPYGVIPQNCTISGYNIFYNPSRALISNPLLKTAVEIDLGKTGELIALMPDYGGIMDCVQEYAEMLSNASAAVNCNLYNSKLSYVFYAKNKAQADSYKKMYDQIGTGTPAVFVDSKLSMEDTVTGKRLDPYEPFNASLSSNYITTDILEDMRRIEHMFCQKIGLPNTDTEKKERMSTDEVNKTDVESVAGVDLWYDTIQEGIKRVKKLYPDITLTCTKRYPTETEGSGDNVTDSDADKKSADNME